jgi:hypothetical protein
MTGIAEPMRLEIIQRVPFGRQPALDGAWWPRSRNLVDQLPALITELGIRGARVSRVLYNPLTWDGLAPRKLGADGRIIRLGWFRSMDPHLLTLTATGGLDRYDLLIVPPDATPANAKRAMDAAIEGDNHRSASAVLEGVG